MNETLEILVEVNHVWKSYGKIVANEDVTLNIRKGEIVGLLGPNGAGKTTLVKQIYGELHPSQGEIKVLGGRPTDGKIKRMMGVVPQEVTPYGELSVYDNLYFMAKIKGVDKPTAIKNVEDVIEKLNLKDRRKTFARDLSGGLRRRLLIGMALVNSPKLLILDEPTTGLDPEARREVWFLLKSLRDSGIGVLLTTHYLDEAERLSDRIYFVNRKVIAQGTPMEIKRKFSLYYEVIDITSGNVYYVKEDEVKDFLSKLDGKFEVRLPSLEEIYLKVMGNDS
ncbi:ABC transporter ATP-binding protein [Sulfuracidifex metallicus]|uniref:ABC transporter ATP-binding protein n=1 Tax=Sulfuracidifex metallicus TaxID=47303 RepID=UPI0022724D8C|nr:ABC transporter ATP-binding protein [Sulfuracidifex metallicus]MCY0849844.1 ABC transporter ATP-binding protein [Sulfuracidifex metallicus]